MNTNLNIHPGHRLVRGLVVASGLAVLLVGAPLLLLTSVGLPLALSLPSGSELEVLLRGGSLPVQLLVEVVALVLWVVWLQLVVAVVLELMSALRQRRTPRLRAVPGPMQHLAAKAVGAALAIGFVMQQAPVSAFDGGASLPADTATAATQESSSEHAPRLQLAPVPGWGSAGALRIVPAEDPASADLVSAAAAHVVERHDSLRGLAQRYLGDAERWQELFELNKDRPQSDGGTLTDPFRLREGWRLELPPGASLVVVEGDTLWGLAERHLGDPTRWPELHRANQHIIEDPNLIYPGWRLEFPSTPSVLPNHEMGTSEETNINGGVDTMDTARNEANSPAVSAGADLPEPAFDPATRFGDPTDAVALVHSETTSDATSTAEPEIDPSAQPDTAPPLVATTGDWNSSLTSTPEANSDTTEQPIITKDSGGLGDDAALLASGLGVLAAGVGWTLARRRRKQRRNLPEGTVPPPLREALQQMEEVLGDAADPESADYLDAALRAMAARLTAASAPRVVGVSLGEEAITILLDVPSACPAGFESDDDGYSWRLDRATPYQQLLSDAEGTPAPLPALVSIGEKDGEEFLLNLEHAGCLGLDGPAERIAALCATMATQLASSHLADVVDVLCVGFGQELTTFDRVQYAPDPGTAIERVQQHRRQSRAVLGEPRLGDGARVDPSCDSWQPLVVLVPDPPAPAEAERLVEAAGQSVCMVVAGTEDATWQARLGESELLLEPVGLRLTARDLHPEQVQAVAGLMAAAADTEGAEDETIPPLGAVEADPQGVPVDVEVQVLGAVEVVGSEQPFTSRRALDLVAYLAMHPDGADKDQLMARLWPADSPPSEAVFANTVTRARRSLGYDDDGEPYLPRVGPDGVYRLAPQVGTDLTRFETLVAQSRTLTGDEARHALRSALKLVRGVPFTGGGGSLYRWADFGTRSRIDYLVDTAAHELAESSLAAGDSDTARWAAQVGTGIVGACEQCYRLRMLAADAAGNTAEVRQIMAELVALMERDAYGPEADDVISSDLLELYEQLTRQRKAS